MIYRILIDEETRTWDPSSRQFIWGRGTLKGASSGLSDLMWKLHLPAPNITNRRARFYFTERGWRIVGRPLASEARRRGHVVKVIRRKNPRRSQIVYRDALQLALLPSRKRREPG